MIKYTIYSDNFNNQLVTETEIAMNDKTAQHM